MIWVCAWGRGVDVSLDVNTIVAQVQLDEDLD